MRRTDVSYEAWLDETFGRAVTGEYCPQFVRRDDEPPPVSDETALIYLTRLFENSEESLQYFSDRQISCGLWELGPGDSHCAYNRDIPIEDRLRLVGSVATFFRDFFDQRCLPKLSHLDKEHTKPLNGICYMWWEVITWGRDTGDLYAERLTAKDLDVMEAVLRLPNVACKESALHGLGHMVGHSDRAYSIIQGLLANASELSPEVERYARSASTGCIQ